MSTKVGVVSLGCDKNRVDTEVMLAKLAEGGYEIVSDPEQADVIIVNTCAFLESARKEAIDTVLEMARYKVGSNKKVIVTGCLGQKFGDELFAELTEADAVVGAYEYDDICAIVAETQKGSRKLYNSQSDGLTFGTRILTTAPHVAYLKIADGCNNFCTYCLIPYIRGRYRSVPREQIVAQARELAAKGVKELILVAQDTTRYGTDLYGEAKITELLQELSAVDDIRWLRLLYCYPEQLTDKLIEEIASNPKIVNYADIPLQHVDDLLLRQMNRHTNSAAIDALCNELAERGIAVRSTFICGFPGETEQTVAELEDFVKSHRLRNVGFFAYSREEGTAAAKMPNQVAERTKQRYLRRLYKTQQEVAKQLCAEDIGRVYECIVDEFDDFDGEYHFYKGRTYFMTPEIDGCVYIASKRPLQIGNFYNVRVNGALDYDLSGEVVE